MLKHVLVSCAHTRLPAHPPQPAAHVCCWTTSWMPR